MQYLRDTYQPLKLPTSPALTKIGRKLHIIKTAENTLCSLLLLNLQKHMHKKKSNTKYLSL